MARKSKKPPIFDSEDAEREFWAENSPLDYFELSKAKRAIFPNLKPTLRSISLRLPEEMIDSLKVLANRQDVPYQSLVKMMLAKQLREEQRAFDLRPVRPRKKGAA